MEPLLEKADEEKDEEMNEEKDEEKKKEKDEEKEEEKSKISKTISNRASTCTSYSIVNKNNDSFTSESITLNPEDLLNSNINPTSKDIHHCLIKELKSIKIVPNLCCCFPYRTNLKDKNSAK
mmetsp:Transcript_6639/g.5745  ORF Transcript_6639/g.5745 Transcript_6639/m.5745 type:complete len:122 (+) Transcript_6639:807-1172(+)